MKRSNSRALGRISVIMASKNAEATIATAVKSALIGLRGDDELLVMNDNSDDRTSEVLESIRDERVRIFNSRETLGRSEARNSLIRQARFEIIAVLDADDISLPWRFEIGRKALESFDAVFSSAIIFGEALRGLPFAPQIPRLIPNERFGIELLGRNPIVHSTAMYRKAAIPHPVAYRDSEAEEYDLWLRMVNSGLKLRRYRAPWVMYRLHPNQASRQEGFDERGDKCKYVREEQSALANSLGFGALSLAEAKHEARSRVSSTSRLARLEVRGLSDTARKFLGTSK